MTELCEAFPAGEFFDKLGRAAFAARLISCPRSARAALLQGKEPAAFP